MPAKILITGGAGYIGTVLVPMLLNDGHHVTVLDSFLFNQPTLLDSCIDPKLTVVRGDCRDKNIINKLMKDVERLQARKPRTGKSSLRGRSKKVGKSVLFVTKDASKISKACGALPGVEVRSVKELSVLDLAPGSDPIRLTVYSKAAIEEIAKIKSTHLELMVKIK